MRRFASSRKAVTKTPYLQDQDLTFAAYERLVTNLTQYGNELTEEHKAALMRVVGRFTLLANGASQGRYAYPLPCGAGKTQAVVAWGAALHELGKPYTMQVCASKVEALCDLKRDLMANGVPEAAIGLRHKYDYDPIRADDARKGLAGTERLASMPANTEAEAAERPILLVTHNRVKGGGGLDQYLYRGRARNLVVWDESLIHSQHRAIERIAVEAALGFLKPYVQRDASLNPDMGKALAYLSEAWTVLDAELQAQKRYDREPRPVRLPPLDPSEIDRYTAALSGADLATSLVLAPLRSLLEISQSPLRVLETNQGGAGTITYDIVVPSELRNVAILDASWPIRDLERLDKTIKEDVDFNGDIKTYRNVTVYQLFANAGRGSVTSDFKRPREERLLSKEIVEFVKTIPETEAAIIFTFKPRKVRTGNRVQTLDMAEKLKSDLEAAGVDIDAKVAVQEQSGPAIRDRFVWLTFGQETSISEYQYASNVLFAGVLHRSDADLAGAIIGQTDDLLRDVSYRDILEVRRSEIAHTLYQGMSRGSCRRTKNGEAFPMRVLLPYPDTKIRPLIDKVMPGLQWSEWTPKFMTAARPATERTAERIAAYLAQLPSGTLEVSIRALKAATNTDGLSNRAFQQARDAALKGSPGWSLSGRTLVRAT